MITVLKEGATEEQRNQLISWFEEQGVQVHAYVGEFQTVLGLIGDTSGIDVEMLELLDIVERVTPISEPFKSANRKFHPEDSVIDAGGVKIGGGNFAVIAGPCSVENPEQIKDCLLSTSGRAENYSSQLDKSKLLVVARRDSFSFFHNKSS